MSNLYLVTTKGLGEHYVVAADPAEAENALLAIYNKQNYGYSSDRKITNIKILAESFRPDFRDKENPYLHDKETKLLIVKDWNS